MAKSTMPLMTLLTDFGERDGYVAAMKGVILQRCPNCRIVDVTHSISPGDVMTGAYILAQAAPYFPHQTVHVVVVDPGVGTSRRILAARFSGQSFVFPDNGVISMIAERMLLEEIATVSNVRATGGASSTTFHGRDIFAPAAARILDGAAVRSLGPKPGTYKLLDIPRPALVDDGIRGHIIYVDNFGNLISNIPEKLIRDNLGRSADITVSCGDHEIGAPVETYGRVEINRPLSLINSMGLLEIAVNQGSARQLLGGRVGDAVRLSKKRAAGEKENQP